MVMDWNVFDWNAHYTGMEKFLEEHPDIDGVFGGDMAAIACMNAVLQKGSGCRRI